MPLGEFPGFSLIALIFKQITTPLSKSIVRYAQAHPFFRKYFLVTPGRLCHWADAKMKLYVAGEKNKLKIEPPNETVAMEQGAQLMIEILIFTIAGLILVIETNKSSAKSTALELKRKQGLRDMMTRKDELMSLIEQQEHAIRQLQLALSRYSEEVGYPVYEVLEEDTADGRSS